MKDFEKMRKYLQRDFELMMVLYIIFSIPSLLLGRINEFIALYIGIRIVVIILFGFGINFAKKGKMSAGIFGIIVSILMILSKGIITLLLGIFMLIHSIIYLCNYNKLK